MSYEKQNFVNGQVLTAEHMNHIEDGIVSAESASTAYVDQKVGEEAQARTTAISAAIAQEVADRNQAIAVEKNNRENQCNYIQNTSVPSQISAAISDEADARNTAISEAIAQEVQNRNSAINKAIAAEASDRNDAISDAISDVNDDLELIRGNMLSDEELLSKVVRTGTTVNLFNYREALTNKGISTSTGKPGTNANFDCSDFIIVVNYHGKSLKAGAYMNGAWDYTCVSTSSWAFYDGNENMLSGGSGNTGLNTGVVVPNDAVYFRFSIRKSSYPLTSMYVVLSTTDSFPDEYVSFLNPVPGEFIEDIGEEKADKDGSYSDLAAGQLLSTTGTVNPTPYTYRENASGSDRVTISQITGGTVVFNQLSPDTASLTTTVNGVTAQITGTAWKITGTGDADGWISTQQAIPAIVSGHVYAVILSSPIPNGSTGGMRFGFSGTGVAGIYDSKIATATASKDSSTRLQIRTVNGAEWNMDSHVCVYDLTQMFGATVAAEFQRIETATPGAGVALFRAMFQESYYQYNAGELLSVQTAGRKTIGFNLWDEEWEVGSINVTTGQNQSSTTAIRSKNYIPVIPGSDLYMKVGDMTSGTAVARWYDYSHNYLGNLGINLKVAASQTVPNGACYVRFVTQSAWNYGTTYKHDICINIFDPSRNGEYESYSAHTYPLDSTLTLRGVPVLTDGVPAYDGDQYEPDGTVTRRYGIVDLGTLTWSIYQSTAGCFRAVISDYSISSMGDAPDFICGSAKYTPINTTNSDGIFAAEDKIILHQYNIGAIVIKDSEYGSDTSALAASLSGVYLVYELATPATETAAPYQSIQIAGSTEEFLPPETDTRAVAVPVGSVSLYQTNLREGLETLLDTNLAHAESIAPVQGATASTNIASGELLMQDGKLYKATQAIVAGAEIVPGTNATQTSVADVFKPTVYQLTPQGTGVTLDTDVSNIKVFPAYGLAVLTVKFTVTSSITNYLAFASCTDVRPNMGLGSDDGISVVVVNATATKRITLVLRPNGWMRVYPADTADNDGTYYTTVVYPV